MQKISSAGGASPAKGHSSVPSSSSNMHQMHGSAANLHRHHAAPVDIAIEVGEYVHKKADNLHTALEEGNAALKFYQGNKAFRQYSWLRNAPIANKSGNFRGMVVNAKWRTAFNLTVENAEKLEKWGGYLAVAGVALDVIKQHERIGSILASPTSASEKAQRLTALGSMAIFNAVGSVLPLGAHLIATPMAAALRVFPATKTWGENVSLMDTSSRLHTSR
jgi:hypothetical protein